MRVQNLSSGSKGNCTVVQSDGTTVLVDLGLSCKETERRMSLAGVDPAAVDAILVTHEHSDHIRGIRVFSKRYNVPVWIGERAHKHIYGPMAGWQLVNYFEPGHEFRVGSIAVRPFRIPHDTSDPVAFRLSDKRHSFGIATDLGHAPELVIDQLQQADLLLIESNHDEKMLWDGPYPWVLKRRVASKHGHLSNAQSAELIDRLWHDNLQGVILGHLSEENNRPELALQSALAVLQNEQRQTPVFVASQYDPTDAVELK